MFCRSEHERHTGGCPFIRGEYTENVPSSTTEASHPAVCCSENGDSVVCISSTSTGTGLTAVGTERGHISIWELDRGLLIMVCWQCSSVMIVQCMIMISSPITSVNKEQMTLHNVSPFGLLQVQNDTNTKLTKKKDSLI